MAKLEHTIFNHKLMSQIFGLIFRRTTIVYNIDGPKGYESLNVFVYLCCLCLYIKSDNKSLYCVECLVYNGSNYKEFY